MLDLQTLAERARQGAGRGLRRLLRRLAAPAPRGGGPDPGPEAVADGEQAVALVEAWIGDAAALSPAASARTAGRTFRDEAAHEGVNLLGRPVTALPAASPRGALAAALGLAEAGRRAAVFVTGAELETGLDLLARAVERRLPVVIHLTCGGGRGQAPARLAATAGAGVLIAANVQEAVDLTLVGRRLAEEALLPVVVAQDAETAGSLQEVHLPSAETVRRFLGSPADTVHPATPAQELLFGRHRRRLFAAHDPEQPRLSGARRDPAAERGSIAGRGLYLDAGLSDLLGRGCQSLAALTGRSPAPVVACAVIRAERMLVAAGAAVEIAEAAIGRLRADGLRVGMVGLRSLAPFPAAALNAVLAGVPEVVVLEREALGVESAGGRLAAEIRALLGNAAKAPRVVSAVCGPGGRSLSAGALLAAARASLEDRGSPMWLGVEPAPDLSAEPKRQAVRDALLRDHPEAAAQGLAVDATAVDLRPAGALTVAIPRHPATGRLTGELAAMLHRALGGHLRGRRGDSTDLLTWSPEPLQDPGDGIPVELRLTSLAEIGHDSPGSRLGPEGALVLPVPSGLGEEELARTLGARVSGSVRVFTVVVPAAEASLLEERQLGALLGVLEQTGRISGAGVHRKLLDARKALLADEGLEPGDRKDHLEAFTAGLDGVAPLLFTGSETAAGTVSAPVATPVPSLRPSRAPGAVADAPLDRLPRFWDQVGSLYRRGEEARLLPDPVLGLGALPARSADLRSFALGREMLPAFDPALCTGCGACWSGCPHGALEPAVVGMEALLDTGMARASAAGQPVDVLRGVRTRLASALAKELAGTGGGAAGPMLDRAFETATAKMPLPEERRQAIRDAFQAVRAQLEALPMAGAEPFPEQVLTLAIDPDACRGCGLCVAVCEPQALTAQPDGAERTAIAGSLLDLADALPAPSRETVERARAHPGVGPLAGALLDRDARRVMGGGEGAEPGSGAALAVRRVLGAAAWHLAPRRRERLDRFDTLRKRLAAAIHDELAGALPERDLDALAHGLEALDRPEAALGEITGRVEGALESERVDVLRLRRLVQLAREVADLAHRLATAAPFGVLLGPGADELAVFPWNPFAVPVTVDPTGESAEIARGLAAGRLQEVLEEARLLRRAERELDKPQEAALGAEIALRPEDLGEDERRGCPPLWVIAEESELAASGLAGLLDLLTSSLPVRVLLLTTDPVPAPHWLEGQKGAGGVFAQTSLAAPEHLEHAVVAAAEAAGAALIRIHAPSPSRQRFAPEQMLARAQEALAAGRFPLYPSVLAAAGGSAEIAAGAPSGAAEPTGSLEERHRQQMAALQAEHEARLAALETEIRIETARRVRGRLLELAMRGGARPAGTGNDSQGESVGEGS